MNSTYLLIGTIVFLALLFLVGYLKGFIKLAVSMVAVLLALTIAYLLTPVVTDALKTTEIFKGINSKVYDIVDNNISGNLKEDGTIDFIEKASKDKLDANDSNENKDNNKALKEETKKIQEELDNYKLSEDEVNKLYDEIQLPDLVKTAMDKLGVKDGIDTTLKQVKQNIANGISMVILSVLVYIVLFVVVNILLHVIVVILNVISKLPVLNFINRMGGGLLCLSEGLLILWIACLIVETLGTTWHADSLIAMINQNPFLDFIYSHNMISIIVESIV